MNPTVLINAGQNTISGRSIVNDRAICPQAQEHVPTTETICTLRAVNNTLGDGFVEAIDDNTLIAIANQQPQLSDGKIQGEAVHVPIFEASGQTRVGRFGWKDQHGSLLSFVSDAYLNEMGITNRLRPHDTTKVCKTRPILKINPIAWGLRTSTILLSSSAAPRLHRATQFWRRHQTSRTASVCSKKFGVAPAMWNPFQQLPPER